MHSPQDTFSPKAQSLSSARKPLPSRPKTEFPPSELPVLPLLLSLLVRPPSGILSLILSGRGVHPPKG